KGIHVEFKTKGKSDIIQGVSFSKDEFKFKGSELGLSYSKIEDQFSQSQLFNDFTSISHVNNLVGNVIHDKMTKHDESILSILLSPDVAISGDQDDEQMKKRKRKMK